MKKLVNTSEELAIKIILINHNLVASEKKDTKDVPCLPIPKQEWTSKHQPRTCPQYAFLNLLEFFSACCTGMLTVEP